MRDKMKSFFEDTVDGFVFLAVYFLPALVAEITMKMIAAVFTGYGCLHAVKYISFKGIIMQTEKGKEMPITILWRATLPVGRQGRKVAVCCLTI